MLNNGSLKTREIVAILSLFLGMKLADSTPSLLAQKSQNGFWLVPILSFFILLPSFLLIMYLLKKYKDKNLIELMEAILGKWFGKALGLLFFTFVFLSLSLDSRNYVEQIKILYFPESPTKVIFFIFIGIAFFGAKKGIEVIGYTSWIAFPLIKFSVTLVFLLIFGKIIIQRIFPIFGSGIDILMLEGLQKASIFSEIFIILIAYTATKETKKFRHGVYLGSIFAFLEIILFYFIYTTVFDYNSIQKVAFPFHDITQYIQFGEFFTNIETIFMVFWLFAAYLRFIIFLYLITMIFGAIFEIKKFEPLLLPFSFLSIMIGLLPLNSISNELFLRETLFMIMSPFLILLPVLLWIVALSKGELRS
ncbi:GerAB/ArcD/ProY family transporter [Saliterribacillus persicus]|uniref:Spore germination protein (Amino acid permease) n=1 Tax=Saliterribacillus persicus TaxID=930114 RepID=A0A368X9H9_9BACI|nr:endospore germination permease [Saliterribacillus persicus]RCW64590.1 spore germination protein (amino acid permease) [Saliterribacillus persicus]